jgi:hypothetical protein
MARFSPLLKRRLSFRFCLVTALAIHTFLGNASLSQAAPAPTRVVIGYPSPTPRVAPLWIAQDLDLFGKYGLTAQLVLVRNNQMLTAGLAAGDIDIGYTGGTTVLGAAAAGVELKLIASFVSRGRGYLIVRPDIKKPADLAGKRIGVQSIGGTLWMYVHADVGTARTGYDARPDSPSRHRRPNHYGAGLGIAGDRRSGFHLPHLHSRPQTKGVLCVDGGDTGDGRDGDRRQKKPSTEKSRDL